MFHLISPFEFLHPRLLITLINLFNVSAMNCSRIMVLVGFVLGCIEAGADRSRSCLLCSITPLLST